jgi:hypothetical protein
MFGMKGSIYLCSQITWGAENAVPLHVDMPRTGGKGSDLPCKAALQKYLHFPYQYYILVLPVGRYCCKLCLQTTPEEKITRLKSVERAGQKPVVIILSLKTSDKACIDINAMWTEVESY